MKIILKVVKEYLPLENFWKRYNKAQMDKLSLEREKTVLKDENTKLRVILKQYLDGMLIAQVSVRRSVNILVWHL